MPLSLHFISASTSGHTEYVVDELAAYLERRLGAVSIERQRAESATAEDLLRGDILILGSGTWNNGGVEGQLNMHMEKLLFERAQGIHLAGKHIAFISLGDNRYYYTTRCTEHFMRFLKLSGARMLLIPLIIVNEPYDQGERIERWAEKLISSCSQVAIPPSESV